LKNRRDKYLSLGKSDIGTKSIAILLDKESLPGPFAIWGVLEWVTVWLNLFR